MYGFFKALPFLGKRRYISPPPEIKEDTSVSHREPGVISMPEACLKPRLQRIVKPLPQIQGTPYFEVICKPQEPSKERNSEKQESAQERATQEANGDVREEIEKLKKELQDQSKKRREESAQRRNKSKGIKEDVEKQ